MSLSRPLRVSVSLSLFRCATILALDQFFSKQHVKEIIMIGFVYLYVCLYVCVSWPKNYRFFINLFSINDKYIYFYVQILFEE